MARVIVRSDNDWLIHKTNGDSFNANLTGNTYISNWLTMLVFRSADKSAPVYVCLMRDSVAAPVLSRLKLVMKLSDRSLY